MIKSIKLENFLSFGESQEIDFEISQKDIFDDSVTTTSKYKINLVNCIIGHNAAGKTTVLKGMSFLLWLMSESYSSMESDDSLPFHKHKLHEDEVTKLELQFFNGDDLYQYKVELNRKEVIGEFLGRKKVRGFSRIFEYRRMEDGWKFNSKVLDINKSDLNRLKNNQNRSVLSSLISLGYLPSLLFIKNFESNVFSAGHVMPHPVESFLKVSSSLHDNSELQEDALKFFKNIDIGISGFEFSEAIRVKNGKKLEDSSGAFFIECLHETENGNFTLPLLEESSGTLRSLHILTEIIPILKSGGVVILDEIEAGLHPYVVKKIISLFEKEKSNGSRAQLIFTTHQHLLLNSRTKSQVFIAEKNVETVETEVFRLDDIEGIRSDENFFSKYMAGEYGGVPLIKWG